MPSERPLSVSPGFNSSLFSLLPTFLIGVPSAFLNIVVQVIGALKSSGALTKAELPLTISILLTLLSIAGGTVLIVILDVAPFNPVVSIVSLIFPGMDKSAVTFWSFEVTS